MYKNEYERWLGFADWTILIWARSWSLSRAMRKQIKDRFAVSLKFGTAGLRGVLGAGTNRMNIYVVRQATQGLAN